jgi:hypothetical protein
MCGGWTQAFRIKQAAEQGARVKLELQKLAAELRAEIEAGRCVEGCAGQRR